MRIYSKDKPPAIHKAVAWTLISLLAACGNGTGNFPDSVNKSGSGTTLAATAMAVAVATPASYTVANIGAGFEVGLLNNKILNSRGQVAGYRRIPGSNVYHAMLYQDNTLIDLGTLGGETATSLAIGINAGGQVTGSSYTGKATHAFRYDGATMTDLGALGGETASSSATAINDGGQVAGYSPVGQTIHAFRSDGTTMTDLGALGGATASSFATAINAGGQVIGRSETGKGAHAFRSDGTTMTDLGALGGETASSFATAINASGQVTGNSDTGKATHAFRSDGTTMTDLGALGGETALSFASAINASGLVVGYSFINATFHAFLSDGTTMSDLGALGGQSNDSSARDINASAQVVGKSRTAASVEHAFIKSPGDSQMIDLNTRLTNAPEIELIDAVAISDNGYILAQSNTGWVLLKPVDPVPAPVPATIGAITANDPVAVGMPVNVSVKFSDINTADTHTAIWTWERNGTSAGIVAEPNDTVAGMVTGSATFSAAGLYNVTISVTDSGGLTSTVSRQVVVYDPSAGFVTGGGWIMSPAGAYKADQQMTGRATFGFVSKYLKGANKPTGETEFVFQAGGLNFYSNNYDWLVVGGARAQYKGNGTINGAGNYQFMLTAVDGDLIGKGTADRFRIKIWHHDDGTNTDVTDYDNQLDSTVAGSNQEGTILGGGSINVKIR